MARGIVVSGLVLAVGLLAAWAFGGTQWGILNATNASVAGLHTQIAARASAAAAQTPAAVAIPTMAATAIPGEYPTVTLTVLGTVPCSGNAVGATPFILRSVTDWDNYVASTGCDTPAGSISLSGFNFTAQSVLILQYEDCGTPDTLGVDIWNVYQMDGYLYARCDVLGPSSSYPSTDCVSVAVAIPATPEGVTWTICEGFPSYHCLTPITP